MGSSYGEALLDFDLNFLSPTSNNNTVEQSKYDRQRNSTLIVKKKLVKTSLLIKKYYLQKDELDITEKKLLASKEECKQICIDYGKSMDTCTALENNMKILQNTNKEVSEKCFHMESQLEGLKSHINQLQALVKSRDSEIQSLKVEIKSVKGENKSTKSSSKNHAKKLSLLQKENETLLQDMSLAIDIIFRKMKLNNDHKTVLKKYNKCNIEDNDDAVNETESDNDFEASPFSPCYEEEYDTKQSNFDEALMSPDTTTNIKLSNTVNMCKIQNNSNVTNTYKPQLLDAATNTEPVNKSIDITSPISFSEVRSEYIDSGQNTDIYGLDQHVGFITKESNSAVMVDVGVSPILINETLENALSPITCYSHGDVSVNPINVDEYRLKYKDNCQNTDICGLDQLVGLITKESCSCAMVDRGVSPIVLNETVEKASSPISHLHVDVSTSPIKLDTGRLKYTNNGQNTDICGLDELCSITKDSNNAFMVDRGVSPIVLNETIENILSVNSHSCLDKSTSPVQFDEEILECVDNVPKTNICNSHQCDGLITKESNSAVIVDQGVCPIVINKTKENISSSILSSHNNISPLQSEEINKNHTLQSDVSQQLRDCLEINNSNILCKENDNEIEAIFSKMRMEYELITPLPTTPKKSQCVDKNQVPLISNPSGQFSSLFCSDAAKLGKKFKKGMSQLAKDIDSIKSFLRIQFPEFHQINISSQESSEINILNGMNPKTTQTSNLLCYKDYEPHNTLDQETPISNQTHKLEDTDCNIKLRKLSNSSLNDSLPDNVDNFCTDTGHDVVNSSQNIPQSNNNEIEKSNKFKVRPVVVCKNLNLNDICNKNSNSEVKYPSQRSFSKTAKLRKITRVGKLRRRILPKYKIKADDTQRLNRSHVKLKKIDLTNKKKVITEHDTSETLNDKGIYQKAVEVMAALKSKVKPGSLQDTVVTNRSQIKENTENMNKETNAGKIKKNKSIEENNDKEVFDSESNPLLNELITTRSRSKCQAQKSSNSLTDKDLDQDNIFLSELYKRSDPSSTENIVCNESRKRPCSTEISLEVPSKRVLRSSVSNKPINKLDETVAKQVNKCNILVNKVNFSTNSDENKLLTKENKNDLEKKFQKTRKNSATENYKIDNSNTSMNCEKHVSKNIPHQTNIHPKESLLCVMIAKYGVKSVKYRVNKISESITEPITKNIEDSIAHIVKLPHYEMKDAMNKFTEIIKNWHIKHFLSGFIKYLQSPERKLELFKTVEAPPAPPMTKPEQILLYVLSQLKDAWGTVDVVDKILCSIEYTLFALNRTPAFDVIESMSHFYAVVCRYFKMKSRLRLFILDAMYCIQYKSIILIKQCLKVWTHILPLAHMGIAKNPLVTCLVYLLHFYKCEDRYNNVRDMRILLNRNYFYKFTDWNEAFILDMLRNSIKELRGIPIEKKMLRLAVIILAKRQGPKWCQNNIIKKLLQPIIDDEKSPEKRKEFCISLIGPLMRPYPVDMKVHCEVIMNQLSNMLQLNPSPNVAEAIMTSLIYMNKHNQNLVIQIMLSWKPQEISHEFEEVIRGFVKSKSIKAWKATLAKMPV